MSWRRPPGAPTKIPQVRLPGRPHGHPTFQLYLVTPDQPADIMLPVLPEPEGNGEQDRRADEEGAPGPWPRPPGAPIGEAAPGRRGEHAEPVADGRGDAADQALEQAAAREQ